MGSHLSWRSYLQSKTRQPAFLWRMVIGILFAGAAMGLAVDALVDAWISPGESVQVEVEPDGDDDIDRPNDEEDAEPSPWQALESYARDGNWSAVWWGVPGRMWSSWQRIGAAALGVLTGVCWWLFAVHASQPTGWRDARVAACAVALGLGVLSIWPTIFCILWQEHAWGLQESEQLGPGLQYWIAGVGLREEFAKLLCVLPLLPWLVKRRDELTALIVTACVGVGFAMEENIDYIYGSAGSGTLSRLLVPAPLHMAMTGLIGLAAYRACRWPKDWGPQFLLVFGLVVFAHGLYDALPSLPLPWFDNVVTDEQAFASYLIFLGLIYQFFHELRELRTQRSSTISLTATLLFCVSLVAAATFVYLSAAAGFRYAADMLVSAIVAQSIMVYLFLREMPETMVSV